MLCINRNQVKTSLSSCGHICTNFSIGSRRKGRTENLLKCGKVSFYVMVDSEVSVNGAIWSNPLIFLTY